MCLIIFIGLGLMLTVMVVCMIPHVLEEEHKKQEKEKAEKGVLVKA